MLCYRIVFILLDQFLLESSGLVHLTTPSIIEMTIEKSYFKPYFMFYFIESETLYFDYHASQ